MQHPDSTRNGFLGKDNSKKSLQGFEDSFSKDPNLDPKIIHQMRGFEDSAD